MFVSPTEPIVLRHLGTTSSIPEKYGVDFLFSTPKGLIGIQRKEVKDWVASCFDGRLEKEIGQAKSLHQSVLILEGHLQFTDEGELIYPPKWSKFTRSMHQSLCLSLQAGGWWLVGATDIQDTISWIQSLITWIGKENHRGLPRPTTKPTWGGNKNRDWGIHLLQSFEGVGVGVAGKIYDRFRVPLAWTVTEEELRSVDGVGKGRAQSLIQALKVGSASEKPSPEL